MRGRPRLFPETRQISVLISDEDYQRLVAVVERARVEKPGFGMGDLLRSYIRRGMAKEEEQFHSHAADPKEDIVRQLHAIARTAQRIARELEKAQSPKSAA